MRRSFWAGGLLTVLGIAVSATAWAGDPAAGQAVFKTQCGICHSIVQGKNMVGPSLFGVIGRKSGSVAGFHYSAANRDADIIWDAAILDKYLAAPREVVPGTIMTFPGLTDDEKRADVIAYLGTLR
jgi:cytochrome c